LFESTAILGIHTFLATADLRPLVLPYTGDLPQIVDVNQSMINRGPTAFYLACQNSKLDVVQRLLEVKEIDVRKSNASQITPLWMASQNGNLDVVKLLLASGRDVGVAERSIMGNEGWHHKTAAEKARINHHDQLAALLEDYEREPERVTNELRKELGTVKVRRPVERQIKALASNLSWSFPDFEVSPAIVTRLHLVDCGYTKIPEAIFGLDHASSSFFSEEQN